jgi:hypothetical protein
MINALRFVGIVNAAIWFGAAVFATLGAGPAFFSEPVLRLVGRPYAGAVAQEIWSRYFLLQYGCGIVAVVHLLLLWIFTGRPFARWTLVLLGVVLALVLWSGVRIQPELRRLHLSMYGVRSTPAQVEQSRKSFNRWHGAAQTANALVLAGLLLYLWQITRTAPTLRFVSQTKFHLE